jgi:NADH-quinone oxidoreductase subunit N
MIYVSLETVSLCSYLLTGWDSSRQRSREAGLKYVLFGGAASGIMLFGMSLLFGLLGSLSLQDLNAALAGSHFDKIHYAALLVSLAFILGGLGYKIAAAPFHMWCPDAYEGSPTPFTALLSTAPKAAGFAVLFRFFYGLFLTPGKMDVTLGVSDAIPWVLLLGIISALSMTIGNFSAMVQNNVKRLLAYSSIAHAGYILIAVVAGGQKGFEAVAVYMTVYLIMNIGAFAIVSAVSRTTGSEDISAFKDLGRRKPLLGILMVIFLVSLTGLPPTAGFVGKLYIFMALVQKWDYWFMILAVIAVFNSVISLYYYARIMKAMYFDKPEKEITYVDANTAPATAVAVVMGALTLLLGLFWQPLAQAATWSASIFH